MIDSLAGASASVTILKTFADAFIKTRDEAKLLALRVDYLTALGDINGKLIDAQSDIRALEMECADLKKEKLKLQEALNKKNSYVSVEFATGLYCYVSKESNQSIETTRKLCADCYDSGAISTLKITQHIKYSARGMQEIAGKFDSFCTNCKREHRGFEFIE